MAESKLFYYVSGVFLDQRFIVTILIVYFAIIRIQGYSSKMGCIIYSTNSVVHRMFQIHVVIR